MKEDKKLILTSTRVYAIEASVDEWKSEIIGYCRNFSAASVKAKKAGWYGADGKVTEKELFQDAEGKLYEVKELGLPTDIREDFVNGMAVTIKSKLSDAEWEFLKANGLPDRTFWLDLEKK